MSQKSPESFKDLFVVKLKAMYDVEQQLVKALPKLAEAANDPQLKQGFMDHLKETQGHVARLEEVFRSIGIQPEAETSETIRGMVADTEWCIENIQDVNVLDAALIAAGQAAEHYEMALYGTAAQWAETMDLPDAKTILGATLEEEKNADEILNTAAMKVNKLAYQETQDVEEEDSKGFMGMGKMQTGNI